MVPTFAPIITPTACRRLIIPEFTNPTTITVVAEEDCITAVTPAPSSTALKGLPVSRSRTRSKRPPENFASPSPSMFIPYRNRARPPAMVRKSKKSIHSLSCLVVFCLHCKDFM